MKQDVLTLKAKYFQWRWIRQKWIEMSKTCYFSKRIVYIEPYWEKACPTFRLANITPVTPVLKSYVVIDQMEKIFRLTRKPQSLEMANSWKSVGEFCVLSMFTSVFSYMLMSFTELQGWLLQLGKYAHISKINYPCISVCLQIIPHCLPTGPSSKLQGRTAVPHLFSSISLMKTFFSFVSEASLLYSNMSWTEGLSHDLFCILFMFWLLNKS